VLIIRRSKLYYTASGIVTPAECDDTRCCIIQFWPPDGEHIVLETRRRHVEAYKGVVFLLSADITDYFQGHVNRFQAVHIVSLFWLDEIRAKNVSVVRAWSDITWEAVLMSPKLQISFLSAVAFSIMSVSVFRLALLKLKHVKVVSENLVSVSQKTQRHKEE